MIFNKEGGDVWERKGTLGIFAFSVATHCGPLHKASKSVVGFMSTRLGGSSLSGL